LFNVPFQHKYGYIRDKRYNTKQTQHNIANKCQPSCLQMSEGRSTLASLVSVHASSLRWTLPPTSPTWQPVFLAWSSPSAVNIATQSAVISNCKLSQALWQPTWAEVEVSVIYRMSQKNIHPRFPRIFFHKVWEFLANIFHAYYMSISMLNYQILSNCAKLCHIKYNHPVNFLHFTRILTF